MKDSQYLSDVLALIKTFDEAITAVENCGKLTYDFFTNPEYWESPNMIILYATIMKNRMKRLEEILWLSRNDTEVAMEDRFASLRDSGICSESVSKEFKEIISTLFSAMAIDEDTMKVINYALEENVHD